MARLWSLLRLAKRRLQLRASTEKNTVLVLPPLPTMAACFVFRSMESRFNDKDSEMRMPVARSVSNNARMRTPDIRELSMHSRRVWISEVVRYSTLGVGRLGMRIEAGSRQLISRTALQNFKNSFRVISRLYWRATLNFFADMASRKEKT